MNSLELIRSENSGHHFPRHFHSGFTIGIIENGRRQYSRGGEKLAATTGSIIVINPGEVHACCADNLCCYEAMCPDDPAMAAWLNAEGQPTICRFTEMEIRDRRLYGQLKELFFILKQSGLSLEKQSLFTTAMAQLFNRYGEKARVLDNRTGTERHAVAIARDYLEDNYAENISLKDLSLLVGFSPYHLLRVFSAEIGLPPHVYQTRVRIKRARTLLAQGEMLAEVAAAAGFADQAHFTRCFKRHMGVTPGRYQAMITRQGEVY